MPSLTPNLERAVARAAALPEEEQDALASVMLAEIEDARRWDELFADGRSQVVLGRLAAEALAEDEVGLSSPLEELLAEMEEAHRTWLARRWSPTRFG